MKNKIKFAAKSPLGYTVECTEDRWENHVLQGHSMMAGNEQAVIDAIENPIVVYPSKSHREERHVYFGDSKNASYSSPYTKVIVGKNDDGARTITAFPKEEINGNIEGGEVLYVCDKPRFRK